MFGKSKGKYEIDMCNGPILGKMLMFAVPLMFSSILQLLFNAADIVVVGKWAGDDSLAAVGSTSSLINLLTNLFIGLSIGANVLVARYYGAKQDKELNATIHTSMLLSLISGVILTVIGVFGAHKILALMQTPEDVLPLATIYIRIYFLGMTSTMIYNFGSAILRAVGDTKRPLYYLLLAGVVNVVLNLIFVIVFSMGVAGVATATAISQTISAVLVVRCLIKDKGSIHLELKELRIEKDKFIRILQIGLPAGFQGILFSLSNVFIQSSVNSFGKVVVAGNSAASNIEGFVYVAMNAFYQAAISFMGQNVGAGKYERINKILITAEACVAVIGIVLGNMVFIFGEPLLGIYSDTSDVVAAGLVRLSIISTTYALCGMMDTMVGALRGLGYSIMPMIVSLLGACAFRLVWLATIFQMDRFHTIEMVYISYPVSWTLTFTTHLICFIIVRKKLAKKWGR
ncbi:MAG: MATE family efflux transporter [Lachnospiraceae bacterium]|nr:MATE family efflux transporter [Lachnospiraceae bacterium]